MGEDTTVLKKTQTRMTQMQKTHPGREFSRILKFKALATKKRTVLPTEFTHSPPTDARRNSISGTHAELWQNAFASGARKRTNANTFASAQLWQNRGTKFHDTVPVQVT